MVLFRDQVDRQLFLMELGKPIHEDVEERDHKLFIQSRNNIVPQLKSFRKRQDAKHSWNQNTLRHIFSIRRQAHSPEGRRFHRQLGRFLATRGTSTKRGMHFTHEELRQLQNCLLEEAKYYNPVHVQVALELLIEEISADLKS